MRLRWPRNPSHVRAGDMLDLSLLLENAGPARIEFDDSHLVLFGRLLDERGEEVRTPSFVARRELPLRHYAIEPGKAEPVGVSFYLSRDDEAALPAGSYTVVLPLGDKRDPFMNSVLTSAQVEPPESLLLEVEPR